MKEMMLSAPGFVAMTADEMVVVDGGKEVYDLPDIIGLCVGIIGCVYPPAGIILGLACILYISAAEPTYGGWSDELCN